MFEGGFLLPVEALRVLEELPPGVPNAKARLLRGVGEATGWEVALDAVYHRATPGGKMSGLLPGGGGLRMDVA
jgi:hypothetical protein